MNQFIQISAVSIFSWRSTSDLSMPLTSSALVLDVSSAPTAHDTLKTSMVYQSYQFSYIKTKKPTGSDNEEDIH